MLRNKPRLTYSGLSIVMSNASRFDTLSLLNAGGGVLFNNLLQPEYNQMQCDVRLAEDTSPWLEGTRAIMLLGESAMHKYCNQKTGNNTIHEMRGSPLYVGDIPAIASYLPQDSVDFKNYEAKFNPLSSDYTVDDTRPADDEDDDEGDVKRFSNTKRGNYAFWLKADITKVKGLLRQSNTLPKWLLEDEPIYRLYPSSQEVVDILYKHKDYYLEFDMETDYEEQNMLCFSFTFWKENEEWNKKIYCVPTLDFNYRYAYTNLSWVIKALAVAIKHNILVAHNGAGFDFIVLAYKYHIPIYRTYDTMIAQHRIYPDIEKSLGHCTSFWTNQTFHKDTDSQSYFTQEHLMSKLKYCGKDVFTMMLIHKAQIKYAKTVVGLESSIECGMNSIRPYVIMMLQGIRYSEETLTKVCNENDRLMMQYLRIIGILIGEDGMKACRSVIKGKAKGFANSNSQCCEYFHNLLEYKVVAKSQKTGKPSLGKEAMYKLALQYNNPVITFVMLYRQVAKEYSSLRFVPWKDDNKEVINYGKWKATHIGNG